MTDAQDQPNAPSPDDAPAPDATETDAEPAEGPDERLDAASDQPLDSSDDEAEAAPDDQAPEETPGDKDEDDTDAEEPADDESEESRESDEGEERAEDDEETKEHMPDEETPDDEPAPEPEPGAALAHDGLESGLAWFGAEPFVPPLAPGMRPSGAAAATALADETAGVEVAEAPALSAAERRQRMMERLEARRREARAKRKWYQRVPIPVWFTLPGTVFIVYWLLFVAKPWDRVPEPTARFDDALLAAPAAEDQPRKLAEARITTSDNCFRLLASGEMLMDAARRSASFDVAAKGELENGEVSCEVCLLGQGVGAKAWLSLDHSKSIALGLDTGTRESAVVKRAIGERESTRKGLDIARRAWYELRIRVEPGRTRYFINGYELRSVATRPERITRIVLFAEEARVAFRNWKITPIE